MKTQKSKEYDIRAAVVRKLLRDGFTRQDIRLEIPLATSSSGGRADVVLFIPHPRFSTAIGCIELKSGCDVWCEESIKQQTGNYRGTFDFVGVVVDRAHYRAWETQEKHGARKHDNWDGVNATYCHATKTIGEQGRNFYREKEYKPFHDLMPLCSKVFPQFHGGYNDVNGLLNILWADECRAITGSKCTRSSFISDWTEKKGRAEVRPLVIAALRGRILNSWEQKFWERFDKEDSALAA